MSVMHLPAHSLSTLPPPTPPPRINPPPSLYFQLKPTPRPPPRTPPPFSPPKRKKKTENIRNVHQELFGTTWKFFLLLRVEVATGALQLF